MRLKQPLFLLLSFMIFNEVQVQAKHCKQNSALLT